ncbi:MAG: hypothetical protein ACO1N0_20120 [Fluviicola sp.]
MIKQYLGIILSVIYALIIRLLAGWHVIEMDSLSFFVIAPMALGFIPFYFSGKGYRRSLWKAILFPLISVLLFLMIAMGAGLEDIVCLIIIGWPYVLFSICMSVALYFVSKEKKDDPEVGKQAFSILLLPVALGVAEKQLPKYESVHTISNELVIHQPDSVIWKNLYAVPDLRAVNSHGFFNELFVPQPTHSTYDPQTNTRLGYFENGIVLHESVSEAIKNKKLTFRIHLDRSRLSASPTLDHVLKNKSLEFEYIGYELKRLDNGSTSLKLTTKYAIHSNIPYYGEFWSTKIVNQFEKNLLRSLKRVLEE